MRLQSWRRWVARNLTLVTFLGMVPQWSGMAIEPTDLEPQSFLANEAIQKKVAFWVQIYTVYSSHVGLIHDAKYIDHVYEIIDLASSSEKPSVVIRRAKSKWKRILLSLHHKQNSSASLSTEEKQILDMFRDVHEDHKFLNAAHRKRLRFQLGQKDQFLAGLYESGRYLQTMEEIFKKEGVPKELTRLPFVESSFNSEARSKVGASGMWQFMRSTAQLFIQVDEAIDERNDPLQAAHGAARLLRLNYDSLKSWPLAVTAYNHGRKGLMRAVRKVGSDQLEQVVSDYRQRSFGFASSNFFAQLLAAIEVEKNTEKYFGKVVRAQPIEFVEVSLPDYISFQELASRIECNPARLRELNQGLTEAVLEGVLLIPAHYPIRIPISQAPGLEISDKSLVLKHFFEKYAQIPSAFKLKAQRPSKYGTSDKLHRHRNRSQTSSKGDRFYVCCRNCRGIRLRKDNVCKKNSLSHLA